MAKQTRIGTCQICGDYGKLSFEHVPPESAFNDRPICAPDIRKVIEGCDPDMLLELKGKINQRGAGDYTLCEPCNSKTGHWYGPHYASWAYQAYSYVSQARDTLSLAYPYHIFPLHIIKQVLCMFFSANPPSFRKAHEDLVRFVLNPTQKYLDPSVRIYAAYTNSDRSRQSGITGRLTLDPDYQGASTNIYSEISFPPFTYVFCPGSNPPDDRLFDISFFAQFGFKEFASLNLTLPLLPIYTWIPGDYRTRSEVRKNIES